MLRSLTYYWRVNLAVLLGAATTSAVLSGALLVGDSVRGSLRDQAQSRLGRIERVALSEGFVREDLGDRLAAGAGAAPAIRLRGTATHAISRARATRVNLLGVDARFFELYQDSAGLEEIRNLEGAGGAAAPAIVLNESLAKELGARAGDPVLLTFPRGGDLALDTLIGRREADEAVEKLRCVVAAIIPDKGPGGFALEANQTAPLNGFLPLPALQRSLDREKRVNALLLPEGAAPAIEALGLDELGLTLASRDRHLAVEASELVLKPEIVSAIESAVASLGAASQRIQTYIANEIRSGGRLVPYSTVSAFDPVTAPLPALMLLDGAAAPRLTDEEIHLNEWAAEDLQARVGDKIDLDYFVVGDRHELITRGASFTLRGVVAMYGMGADPTLTPEYPGMARAQDIVSWDPPFPVDLTKIRPRDEEYWDRFRAAPKAFISQRAGARLWASRYGTTTSVRVAPAALSLVDLGREIKNRMTLPMAGIEVREVKHDSLAAAEGSTDFGALFLGFSLFLIVSSALLSALMFRLGVEQRAREIGLLLASGYRVRSVRRRFLSEGLLLAAAGSIIGLPAGVAYAAGLMLGLRTIWREAVGSSVLELHVETSSLLMGAAFSVAAVMVAIVWSVNKLARLPVSSLLAGRLSRQIRPGSARLSTWTLAAGVLSCLALLMAMLASGGDSSPALALGVGTAALVSALSVFSIWCHRAGRRRRGVGAGPATLPGVAARNCSWNPPRSLLSVALIGSACFVIVAVTASMRGETAVRGIDSPSGGFALAAESEIPLHGDLNTAAGRADLGLPVSAEASWQQTLVVPFRLVPGDDASCLNLYRPERPRLLGVPEQQIQRGGFRFHGLVRETPNPWKLLDEEIEPGVIPAIGDQSSVLWILHLGLGQDLVMEDERGETLRLRFVGLLEESPFQSEVLIAERRLLEHFPSRSGHSYFLVETPEGTAGEVSGVLEEALGEYGFDAVLVADRIAGFRAVQNTYLSTFLMLGGLGLLMGTVGLGIVVARNILERRGELAAMRAFGFTRGWLGRMILTENLVLLGAGILSGSLSALAAVAPRLASSVGGGAAPWLAIAVMLGLVFCAGLVASLAAVRGALRAPLLPALKEER